MTISRAARRYTLGFARSFSNWNNTKRKTRTIRIIPTVIMSKRENNFRRILCDEC